MKRSDKDPARRPNGDAGDAMTDEFVPAAPDDGESAEVETSNAPQAAEMGDRSADSGLAERALAEQQDKYLRLAAEYDNYRKRSVRERQEASVRGQADLLRGMLDAL